MNSGYLLLGYWTFVQIRICLNKGVNKRNAAKHYPQIDSHGYQAHIKIRIFSIASLPFAACTLEYKNDGKEVTWNEWNEPRGQMSYKVDADPKTFKVIKGSYWRDSRHLFFRDEAKQHGEANAASPPSDARDYQHNQSGRLHHEVAPTAY